MRWVATQKIGPPSSVSVPQTAKKYSSQSGHLVGAVRVQPVVAHADAEADGHVIQDGGDGQSLPAKHEQGGDGPDMQEH